MSSQAPGPEKPAQAQQGASLQTRLQAAKAPVEAYNDKNWQRLRSVVAPDFVYEEVATQRRLEGVEALISCWQTWAKAFPDSRATFDQGSSARERSSSSSPGPAPTPVSSTCRAGRWRLPTGRSGCKAVRCSR